MNTNGTTYLMTNNEDTSPGRFIPTENSYWDGMHGCLYSLDGQIVYCGDTDKEQLCTSFNFD